jgi:Glucose-6-phosphate dehydrogenase subunit
MAQMFDQTCTAEKLRTIKELTIVFHPEYQTTAVLLVAWLASQLGWELVEHTDADFKFAKRGAQEAVRVILQAVPGEWVSEVRIAFREGSFDLTWSGRFLECSWSDYQGVKQLLPAGGTTVADLVNEELARGGEHVTYLRALDLAERLWS